MSRRCVLQNEIFAFHPKYPIKTRKSASARQALSYPLEADFGDWISTRYLHKNGGEKDTKNLDESLHRGFVISGGDIVSRAVTGQVPSARRGLTSVFGMRTGGSLLPLPPEWLDMECTSTTA